MKLPLDDILIDPTIQIRDGLDESTVEIYVESFDALPPIVVFDEANILADGFHRIAAARRLGRRTIEVERRQGGREEAEEYAVTANVRHGKPLTRPERNEGIRRLLDRGWSTRRIARAMGVDYRTVGNIAQARKLRSALPPEVAAAEGLTDTHLYRLATLPEPEREPAARLVVEHGLSEPETRALVRRARVSLVEARDGIRDQHLYRTVAVWIEAWGKLDDLPPEDVAASVPRELVAATQLQLDLMIEYVERLRDALSGDSRAVG